MKIAKAIPDMRDFCATARRSGSLGLVPTMGALHEGHLSLVRAARSRSDFVAASIFVNPTQFGPTEDLSRYPRPLERDLQLLEQEGVDVLFTPGVADMYPGDAEAMFVDPGEMGRRLDGASRPGHFRGVTTVVTKLFHIAGPDFAFFGQKDAAQVAILRRMCRDLDFPVEMVVCPTVREADGLAMSSRNQYLTPADRERALILRRSLLAGEAAFAAGARGGRAIERVVRETLEQQPGVAVDYASLVDADSLVPLDSAATGALLAVAAVVGTTRLIDNVVLGERAQ